MNHKTGAAPLCHRPSHKVQRGSAIMKTRKIRCLAGLIALLLVGACAGCAQQGTASKETHRFTACPAALTIEQLCAQSPTIVRGKIAKYNKSVDLKGMNDSLAGVRTYFTIDVSDFIKGNEKNRLTAESWFLGGETKKQICMPISGTLPQVGDEMIFFIQEDSSYYPAFLIRDGEIVLESFLESKLFTETVKPQQTVSADALVAEIKDIVAAQANTAKQ